MWSNETFKLSKFFHEKKIDNLNQQFFWKTFLQYKKEETKEFLTYFGENKLNDIHIHIYSFSLELSEFPEFENKCFVVRNWIFLLQKQVGEYVLYLDLYCNYVDDVLVIF